MRVPFSLLALGVALLCLASPAAAQTPITRGPLPPGAQFQLEMPVNITSVAVANTFEIRISNSIAPLTALTNVTCILPAPGARVVCRSVITASNRDALSMVGQHELRAVVWRQDLGDSEVSDPFVLTSPAGKPVVTVVGPSTP